MQSLGTMDGGAMGIAAAEKSRAIAWCAKPLGARMHARYKEIQGISPSAAGVPYRLPFFFWHYPDHLCDLQV